MTDGAKDIPVKTHISGYREINIPVVVTLQGTSAKDIPVKVTLQADGMKNVPVAASLETYRVDYGLYGESIYETAPRETIFYAQGGTPDKSIAATDPYWFIKSGASETGKEGFMEMGFGQNDDHNQSDASLTGFVRVQLDSASGEGEIKIKPSLWFYPSSQPTTSHEGVIYYDDTANQFVFHNGTGWETLAGVSGSGTAGTITKWDTDGYTLTDSVITESSGNITIGATNATRILTIRAGLDDDAKPAWLYLIEDNDAGTTYGGYLHYLPSSNIFSIGTGTSGTSWTDAIQIARGSSNITVVGNIAVNGTTSSTISHGDLTYGLSTAITLALGTDDTKCGAIRLYGNTAGGGGLIQATTNNLHIDALGGSIYLGNYDNSIIYFNGTSTYIAVNGDTKLAGNLDVDGGTIEIENSFEIEYNSTSDSLDFNYIG